MLGQMNARSKDIRAQVEMAEPIAEANRQNGRSIRRIFNAIKLNRRPVNEGAGQQSAFSAKDEYARLVATNAALTIATRPK